MSIATPAIADTLVQIAEPFSPALMATVPASAPLDWARAAIGLVWAVGFWAIALARCRSWLGVRAALRAGTPIELPIPVRALITPGAEEPGIVGFLRPVLVLPAQLLEHLNSRQLGAILTHELCHVRRRDNLFAAVHMVVEAIFWFHPLVWWIGSRMVDERELACDEEVLRMGCEPADYVEGILKVCRFYLESPLPCISGVTGADVKKRLRAILAGCIADELSDARKMTLAAIGLAVLAVPVLIGVLTAPAVGAQDAPATTPKFEVASIKPHPAGDSFGGTSVSPGTMNVRNLPVRRLIRNAYRVSDFQISGARDWVNSQGFDIVAKAEGELHGDRVLLMLRALLEDRFQLRVHRETKEGPVYELTVAKSGLKMEHSKEGSCIVFDPGHPPAIGPDHKLPTACGNLQIAVNGPADQ
jgi:bla regulator protein BlaR1